jgi:hypothetical protein
MTSTRAASVLPGGQQLSRNSPMRDRDLSMDAKIQAGAIQPGLRAHILNWVRMAAMPFAVIGLPLR